MSGSNLIDHPQAFVRLTTTVIRLIDASGAATLDAIHRELPYSGYRLDEVLTSVDALVESGTLNVVEPGIYIAGPEYPRKPEVER